MSKEENDVFKYTQKVMMQIVDEHDKWFFTQLQDDMKQHPDKYDNAQLELFERDRIKEVLTLGLNAEKQLAFLQQQLKEKDEEIAKLKELDKATCESLYASRELFEKEKVKRWKLEKQLKLNTKQVCKKIREKFSDGRSHNWGIEQVELYDFLDQIEKGENV